MKSYADLSKEAKSNCKISHWLYITDHEGEFEDTEDYISAKCEEYGFRFDDNGNLVQKFWDFVEEVEECLTV